MALIPGANSSVADDRERDEEEKEEDDVLRVVVCVTERSSIALELFRCPLGSLNLDGPVNVC